MKKCPLGLDPKRADGFVDRVFGHYVEEGRATFEALVPDRFKPRPTLPVFVDDECPPDTIYLLPHGSTSCDLATGRTVKLAPGYYVNPRQLGVITNVK